MENRNFLLNSQWNIIHYPERPSGFGVLIIGDERNFVDANTSFWLQNEGKKIMLNSLQDTGYTVFYSHLYGRNWGSDKAVQLAEALYGYVMRTEILNKKIHIIAEGMGALVAIKLLKEMDSSIRSLIFINPIISLKQHLDLEKDRKFFYKRLMKELEQSFQVKDQDLLKILEHLEEPTIENVKTPIKIIQILAGNRGYNQSRILNLQSESWNKANLPISISYLVPEKKPHLTKHLTAFFQLHEEI